MKFPRYLKFLYLGRILPRSLLTLIVGPRTLRPFAQNTLKGHPQEHLTCIDHGWRLEPCLRLLNSDSFGVPGSTDLARIPLTTTHSNRHIGYTP